MWVTPCRMRSAPCSRRLFWPCVGRPTPNLSTQAEDAAVPEKGGSMPRRRPGKPASRQARADAGTAMSSSARQLEHIVARLEAELGLQVGAASDLIGETSGRVRTARRTDYAFHWH